MFKKKREIERIKNRINELISIEADLANESLDKANEFTDELVLPYFFTL